MLDLRAALRSLRRSPIFAATAVLTLAIGIGATTIIFSIVQAVLVRPLPFAHPDRLVRMWETKPGDGAARVGVSPPDFFDWRDRATNFDGLALFGGDQVLAVLDTPAGSVQVADVAQAILNVLRKDWEMSTADLRDESGVKDRKAFTRGVDELQAAVIVVPSEVFYQPKFTYIWRSDDGDEAGWHKIITDERSK